ncbi:hypothetical protein FTO60_05885 [Octadecabacter sp. SW4]|uniref:hypothetical protein n=1 Tax=Octadecabacter sp. SW4 TaxID=2602067 RepID=UPI0011C1F7F0|nr:hypothetical protein [Octadecabacter sp. SW4]QEE35283.1 hypothetical protein FTO60_05885 [Octadecabacter sp. SW4]
MLRPLLKSAARRYMDVTLRAGARNVRIVERPGAWMPPGALSDLSADLRHVAARTLTGALTYGVFSGDADVMKDVVITVVYGADGTPVAFNALAIMQVQTRPRPREVLHLGLVMIDPDARQEGLGWVLYGLTCFLIFIRNQMRPLWVSNVTQVPAVVGMVSTVFSDVWPRPDGGRCPLQHLLLARAIMASHRPVFGVGKEAAFDESRFVIARAYTGGSDDLQKTWDVAPKHRDDSYNTFCADQLDYGRGDDLLQLGRMDTAAMRRFLAREVPRAARFRLLGAGALVALQRLVLPLIYWSDSKRDYGILRARA